MHQKKFKKTYYQIPTGVFWGMILCILVLLVLEIHSGYRLTEQESNNAFENENQIRIEVTYDDWLSELEDTSQCLLCQENSLAEMTYKSGRDTIGLILLNSWTVLDFQLKCSETEGAEELPDNTSGIHYGHTDGITWLSDGNPARGMANIRLTLPEHCRTDENFIVQNLCQTCLDKVTASMHFWKGEQEEREAVPLCLLDFQTSEVYSAQDWYLGYFIRDYWVELDFEETDVSIKAYYLPAAACR